MSGILVPGPFQVQKDTYLFCGGGVLCSDLLTEAEASLALREYSGESLLGLCSWMPGDSGIQSLINQFLAFITGGKSLGHCIIQECPVIATVRLRLVIRAG